MRVGLTGNLLPLHLTLYINVLLNLPTSFPKRNILVVYSRNYFYNALSVELQESIRLDGYILPNNSTLSTLFDQTPALQLLREIAVVAHQSLAIEKKRVLHLINYVTPRNSRLTNYAADINNMHSKAEETIRAYSSNNPNSCEDRPLVKV